MAKKPPGTHRLGVHGQPSNSQPMVRASCMFQTPAREATLPARCPRSQAHGPDRRSGLTCRPAHLARPLPMARAVWQDKERAPVGCDGVLGLAEHAPERWCWRFFAHAVRGDLGHLGLRTPGHSLDSEGTQTFITFP